MNKPQGADAIVADAGLRQAKPCRWLTLALWLLVCLAAGGALAQPAPMQRQDTEAAPDQLLDEQLTLNPERIQRARARAAEQPPQTADPGQLAAFFSDRGAAALLAGQQQQAIQDLRHAADLARGAPGVDRSEILVRLSNALRGIGRTLPAVQVMREAIASNPQNKRGRLVGWYAQLAQDLAGLGNIRAADEAVAKCLETYDFMATVARRNITEQQRALWHVQALRAQAVQLQVRGRGQQAEPLLQQAMAEAQKQPNTLGMVTGLHEALARIFLARGRMGDAENEARLALANAQRATGANSLVTARALVQLASVLSEQGRVGEAETLIRKSMELIRGSGLAATGSVRVPLAHALAAQGRWPEAYQEYEVLRQAWAQTPQQFEAKVRQDLVYSMVLIKTGRAAEALRRLTDMVDVARKRSGEGQAVSALLGSLHAMALAETGSADEALAEFRRVVPVLTKRSREASDEEDSAAGREQRLRLVIESYMSLLADRMTSSAAMNAAGDPVAESFRLAEAARNQSVVRALAAASARAAAGTPELAELARREQDAQLQLSALNGLLANAISARAEDQDESALQSLRAEIDQLRDQRGKLAEEIERRFPDYANLINPKPASLAEARAKLLPGEALVVFYIGEARSYVWSVAASGSNGFGSARLGQEAVAKEVTALRRSLDPNAQTLDDIPPFDVAAAYRLYAQLMKPTEQVWSDAKSLLVVPHGPLGQLPLALLPTQNAPVEKTPVAFAGYRKVPWLARRVAVSQLPSVASLLALRSLSPGAADRRAFLGFGDPWFSKAQAEEARVEQAKSAALVTRGVRIKLRSAPKGADAAPEMSQLPRLPDTADEVTGVAAALKADPQQDVYLGARASKHTLETLGLQKWRILMFATHGLVPGDLAGLTQPALALSAPEVTGEGGSGLLTTEDILALKLNADWVILSACNTAAGQGAGAEAVSGLGRAFFYAGARALLVSNWPVETSSARTLTVDLFRRQAENPSLIRAEALRQAMVALIDGPGYLDPATGKPLFSYAHPIFWSAFALVGDGGGSWR